MFFGFVIMEAIHSTAIEHPSGCNCVICRAAHGDQRAFAEVFTEVAEQLEARDVTPSALSDPA